MEILYLLVPISVLLAFAFGLVFWWALNHRQFDALDEAASRILEDSDKPADPITANQPSAHAK